jgi:hypothetical protein
VAFGDPRRPRPGQEVDEAGVVHRQDRVEPMLGRLDEVHAADDELLGQHVTALGSSSPGRRTPSQ